MDDFLLIMEKLYLYFKEKNNLNWKFASDWVEEGISLLGSVGNFIAHLKKKKKKRKEKKIATNLKCCKSHQLLK